jgi:arsenate reductase
MRQKVLFLCTGNSARSLMAEALLRHWAGNRFEVYSAGLSPRGIHPLTLQVLEEISVDTLPLRSKGVEELIDKVHFDVVITVCSNAEEHCPFFPGKVLRMHWPCEDPAAVKGSLTLRLFAFRQARDQLETAILNWLRSLDTAATAG